MRFVPAFTVLQELSPTAEMALAFEEELRADEQEKAAKEKAPRLSEEDVRASYEEGYEAGFAAAQAEFAAALEQQKAATAELVRQSQTEWLGKFGEKAAAGLTASLASLRQELARDVADSVLPFLSRSLQERAVESLSEAIREGFDLYGTTEVTVTGPQAMIDALKEKLPQTWQIRERVSEDEVELTAQIDSTVLSTRIAGWIEDLTEPADG
jgi:phosphoribosyl-ATP pyrophosphohydrolase